MDELWVIVDADKVVLGVTTDPEAATDDRSEPNLPVGSRVVAVALEHSQYWRVAQSETGFVLADE